jgi:ABC-type transport system involved in Fe-S cluster assembly fused permease/ATPase subunit
VIVAHRLSTIAHAHQILLLDRGRIAERGTHEELLEKNGRYADMWNAQLKSSEKEEVKVKEKE